MIIRIAIQDADPSEKDIKTIVDFVIDGDGKTQHSSWASVFNIEEILTGKASTSLPQMAFGAIDSFNRIKRVKLP